MDTLDQVFGPGVSGKTPPLPCKFAIGKRPVYVNGAEKRKAHTQIITVTKPKQRCHCVLPEGCNAAKIPDLNPAENLFSLIETELKNLGRTEGRTKNKDELKNPITIILEGVPDSWFQKYIFVSPQTMENLHSASWGHDGLFQTKV